MIYQNRTKTSGILNYVNFLACILLASDWFKNNQLLSQLTDAHYRDKVPLIVIQYLIMYICHSMMCLFVKPSWWLFI